MDPKLSGRYVKMNEQLNELRTKTQTTKKLHMVTSEGLSEIAQFLRQKNTKSNS